MILIDGLLHGTNDPFEYNENDIIKAAMTGDEIPCELWNKTTSKVTKFRPQRKVFQIYLN